MLTTIEIRALLVELLTAAAGGKPTHWRQVIGEVFVLPLASHPRCNWKVLPDGEPAEIAAVHEAVGLVRQQHPHALR